MTICRLPLGRRSLLAGAVAVSAFAAASAVEAQNPPPSPPTRLRGAIAEIDASLGRTLRYFADNYNYTPILDALRINDAEP